MIKSVRQKSLAGSARTPIDYPLDSQTYPTSVIPQKTLESRDKMRDWKRPQILQTRKPSWNASTIDRDFKFPDPNLKHLNKKGTSIRPEIDPRAEVVPKRDMICGKDGKTIWGGGGVGEGNGTSNNNNSSAGGEGLRDLSSLRGMTTLGGGGVGPAQVSTRFVVPVHPDLEGKSWNVSTQLDKHELRKAADKEMTASLQRTQRKIEQVKTTIPSLFDREKQHMQTIRDDKRKKREDLESTTQKRQLQQTQLFQELTQGNVKIDYEGLEREARKKEEEEGLGEIVVSQDWKKKEYEHVGDWKYSELEGCEVWSCCMCARIDGPGCSVKKPTVKKGWNFSSY